MLGEREAQQTAARRSRTLGLDVVVRQPRGIVACLSRLARLVVGGTATEYGVQENRRGKQSVTLPVILAPSKRRQASGCGRHHQEVPQIAIPAHTAHLRHGKALYRLVLVAVARPVVATRNRVGAHLHHSERRGGSWERLAQPMIGPRSIDVRTGADEGIHVGCQVVFLSSAGNHEQPACDEKKFSHGSFLVHRGEICAFMFEFKLSFLPYKSTRKAYIFQTNPQLFYQHTATTLLPPPFLLSISCKNTSPTPQTTA